MKRADIIYPVFLLAMSVVIVGSLAVRRVHAITFTVTTT